MKKKKMVLVKLLRDVGSKKEGKIINYSKQSAKDIVESEYGIYVKQKGKKKKKEKGGEIKESKRELELEIKQLQEKVLAKKLVEEPISQEEFNKYAEEFTKTHPKNILKDKKLFQKLDDELDKKIVHEKDTRKTILLIALGGMLTINCEPTSSNLMVNDESGAGKDYITKAVLSLLPQDNIIVRKRISEKVFTYWHNAKFEPDWTWDGKVFYNEDIGNSILNSDVFKVMSSSDGLNSSTVIVNQMPMEIITKGKPVMVITIAVASPKVELLRRYPICNLNTTENQTKEILKKKAEFHKTGIRPSYSEEIKKCLNHLKRVKVKVPFADKLVEVLSHKHVIIRTHFDRFIDYIKFSAAIHQFQREMDDDGYLIATGEDYENARTAITKTTSNQFSVPLTKNQQKILNLLSTLPSLVKTLDEDSQNWFSVSDIESHISFCSDKMLRIDLERLTDYGFLQKSSQKRENSKRTVMVYKYIDKFNVEIPSFITIVQKPLQLISDDKQNTCNNSPKNSRVPKNITSITNKDNVTSVTSVTINKKKKEEVEIEEVLETPNYKQIVEEKGKSLYPKDKFEERYGKDTLQRLLSIGELYEPKNGYLGVLP